jgi:hypothetical protein
MYVAIYRSERSDLIFDFFRVQKLTKRAAFCWLQRQILTVKSQSVLSSRAEKFKCIFEEIEIIWNILSTPYLSLYYNLHLASFWIRKRFAIPCQLAFNTTPLLP